MTLSFEKLGDQNRVGAETIQADIDLDTFDVKSVGSEIISYSLRFSLFCKYNPCNESFDDVLYLEMTEKKLFLCRAKVRRPSFWICFKEGRMQAIGQ